MAVPLWWSCALLIAVSVVVLQVEKSQCAALGGKNGAQDGSKSCPEGCQADCGYHNTQLVELLKSTGQTLDRVGHVLLKQEKATSSSAGPTATINFGNPLGHPSLVQLPCAQTSDLESIKRQLYIAKDLGMVPLQVLGTTTKDSTPEILTTSGISVVLLNTKETISLKVLSAVLKAYDRNLKKVTLPGGETLSLEAFKEMASAFPSAYLKYKPDVFVSLQTVLATIYALENNLIKLNTKATGQSDSSSWSPKSGTDDTGSTGFNGYFGFNSKQGGDASVDFSKTKNEPQYPWYGQETDGSSASSSNTGGSGFQRGRPNRPWTSRSDSSNTEIQYNRDDVGRFGNQGRNQQSSDSDYPSNTDETIRESTYSSDNKRTQSGRSGMSPYPNSDSENPASWQRPGGESNTPWSRTPSNMRPGDKTTNPNNEYSYDGQYSSSDSSYSKRLGGESNTPWSRTPSNMRPGDKTANPNNEYPYDGQYTSSDSSYSKSHVGQNQNSNPKYGNPSDRSPSASYPTTDKGSSEQPKDNASGEGTVPNDGKDYPSGKGTNVGNKGDSQPSYPEKQQSGYDDGKTDTPFSRTPSGNKPGATEVTELSKEKTSESNTAESSATSDAIKKKTKDGKVSIAVATADAASSKSVAKDKEDVKSEKNPDGSEKTVSKHESQTDDEDYKSSAKSSAEKKKGADGSTSNHKSSETSSSSKITKNTEVVTHHKEIVIHDKTHINKDSNSEPESTDKKPKKSGYDEPSKDGESRKTNKDGNDNGYEEPQQEYPQRKRGGIRGGKRFVKTIDGNGRLQFVPISSTSMNDAVIYQLIESQDGSIRFDRVPDSRTETTFVVIVARDGRRISIEKYVQSSTSQTRFGNWPSADSSTKQTVERCFDESGNSYDLIFEDSADTPSSYSFQTEDESVTCPKCYKMTTVKTIRDGSGQAVQVPVSTECCEDGTIKAWLTYKPTSSSEASFPGASLSQLLGTSLSSASSGRSSQTYSSSSISQGPLTLTRPAPAPSQQTIILRTAAGGASSRAAVASTAHGRNCALVCDNCQTVCRRR